MAKKQKTKTITIDPVFFPHKYQYEMYEQWKRFNVAITCRGWGKTVFAVMALDKACRESKVPLDFAYICPVKAQAWDLISPIIYQFLGHLENIEVGNGQTISLIKIKDSAMEVHYTNGCKFKAYGADHPNNKVIRGKTFGGVVIDEFDDTPFDVWLEIISPCLRTHKGWALFIGTVKPGSNLFKLKHEFEGDPNWNFGVYDLETCWEELPAYDEDEFLTIKKRFADSPMKYAREYMCDPTASDDDVVIPTNLIYEARGKHISEESYSNLPRVMGVDVATGGGVDKSCICIRQGLAVESIKQWNVDNMQLADIIAMHLENKNIDAVFIDKGRGEGVISRLRMMGHNVIGIDFGGSAIRKDIYRDRRVEMYHSGVKGWLELGGSLPDEEELLQELASPCLKPSDGKLIMERKVDIKKKLGRSPDMGDALALTFAAPVTKREHMTQGRNNRRFRTAASTGYDPLNDRKRRHGII